MREDAAKLTYEEVELLGDIVLFSELRIDPDTVPKGLRLYEIRHTDSDWGEPCQVKRWVAVNFFGSVLTSSPIQLCPDGFRMLEYDDFSYTGNAQVTIEAYLAEHPPTGKDVMDLTGLTPEDWSRLFSKTDEADRTDRCIGHLRGDFGDGTEFYTTWWPHSDDSLNTPQFKADVDRVVNWLREKDAPLRNFVSMERFCQRYSYALVTNEARPVYGFGIETAGYQYLLRCMPVRGDYHFYLYCYQKKEDDSE